MLLSCLIVDDEDDENDDNADNDNYDLCLWPWCRWWRREFEFVNFFEFNWCAWAFFRIKQKFFATVPAMKRTFFVWFHTFSKQQRQTRGSGSKCDKSDAQIFGTTSPRHGPNELLLWENWGWQARLKCPHFIPKDTANLRSELNVHCTPNVKLKKILEEPAINSKSVAPRVSPQKKIVFHSKKAMMSVGQVMISAWKKHVWSVPETLGLPQEPAVAYLGWIGFNFGTLGLDFFPNANASVSGSTTDGFVETTCDWGCGCDGLSDGKWNCEVWSPSAKRNKNWGSQGEDRCSSAGGIQRRHVLGSAQTLAMFFISWSLNP